MTAPFYMRQNLHRVTSIAFAALTSAVTLPASAQKESAANLNYPSRTVTLINPFSPGASTDIVARLIAQKLTETWGQTVIVENRPGASGMIGLAAVARAPADGHMLGMIIVTHATSVALQGGKPAVDLVRDFAPITQVVSQPYALVVSPSLPVCSVRELIALAKAKPGALTYGSSGIGSVLHLAGELLAVQTKVQLTHVPYKGAAPALSDVAGGHLAMLFTTRMSAQAMVNAKRVRALAVTSAERVSGAPDLPTVQESGVTGPYEVNGWYGIGAPAGTPAAIVDRLNQDINRVLKMPEVRERMATEGTLPAGGTPAQFGELVRTEVEKWRRIIQQAAISSGLR
jgi:tripartite-type tricarboxylate transporter receptor subunit TctC